MPKVSVIFPTLNNELYIEKAIESIRNQSHSDWEILVWNDGSTDATLNKLLSYKDDLSIRIFSSPRMGFNVFQLCTIHNYFLHQATGDFICVFGGAWEFDSEKLAKQIAIFEEQPQFDLVHCNMYSVDANDELIEEFAFPHPEYEQFRKHLYKHQFLNYISCPTVMMRKSKALELGGFDPGAFFMCDYELWSRFLEGSEVTYIHEPLVKYRIFSNSQSQEGHIFNSTHNIDVPLHNARTLARNSFERFIYPTRIEELCQAEIVSIHINLAFMYLAKGYYYGAVNELLTTFPDFNEIPEHRRADILEKLGQALNALKVKLLCRKYLVNKWESTLQFDNYIDFTYTQIDPAHYYGYSGANMIAFNTVEALLKQSGRELSHHQLNSKTKYQLEQILHHSLEELHPNLANNLALYWEAESNPLQAEKLLIQTLKKYRIPLLIYNLGLHYLKSDKASLAKICFGLLEASPFNALSEVVLENFNAKYRDYSSLLPAIRSRFKIYFVCSKIDALKESFFFLELISNLRKQGYLAQIKCLTLKYQSLNEIPVSQWVKDEILTVNNYGDLFIFCDEVAVRLAAPDVPHSRCLFIKEKQWFSFTNTQMLQLAKGSIFKELIPSIYKQNLSILTNETVLQEELQQICWQKVNYLLPYIPTFNIELEGEKQNDILFYLCDTFQSLTLDPLKSFIEQLETTFSNCNIIYCSNSLDLLHQLNITNYHLLSSFQNWIQLTALSKVLLYLEPNITAPLLAYYAHNQGCSTFKVSLKKSESRSILPTFSMNEEATQLFASIQLSLKSPNHYVQTFKSTENTSYTTDITEYTQWIEHFWVKQLLDFIPSENLPYNSQAPISNLSPEEVLSDSHDNFFFTYVNWSIPQWKQFFIDYISSFKPTDPFTLICILSERSGDINEQMEVLGQIAEDMESQTELPDLLVFEDDSRDLINFLYNHSLGQIIAFPEQKDLSLIARLNHCRIIPTDIEQIKVIYKEFNK